MLMLLLCCCCFFTLVFSSIIWNTETSTCWGFFFVRRTKFGENYTTCWIVKYENPHNFIRGVRANLETLDFKCPNKDIPNWRFFVMLPSLHKQFKMLELFYYWMATEKHTTFRQVEGFYRECYKYLKLVCIFQFSIFVCDVHAVLGMHYSLQRAEPKSQVFELVGNLNCAHLTKPYVHSISQTCFTFCQAHILNYNCVFHSFWPLPR